MDPQGTAITAADVVAIAATVTIMTQFTKALLPGEGWGPYVAICWTAIGVTLAVVSAADWPPDRQVAWPIFALFANVLLASTGVYHASTIVTSGANAGIRGVRRQEPPAPGTRVPDPNPIILPEGDPR